jgi:glycerophosphoryl diester phosphodiesterase
MAGPAIISHRGLCRATARSRRRGENTIAAFAAGIAALKELGFPPAIELDVRRAADGGLVVIHDATLRRTTGQRGRVARCTSEELAALGIPQLDEVLDAFRSAEFHVEAKEPGIMGDLKKLLVGRHLERRAIVSSFHWKELPLVAPELRFALTSRLTTRRTVRTAVQLGAWAIHPGYRRSTRAVVEAAHAAGLRVHAWTVNAPAAYRKLAGLGVDAVFSDNPRLLGV